MEEYPAATTAEGEMQIEAASQIEEVASPLQKLRCLVLARGYDGLLQFGKAFRMRDDERTYVVFTDQLEQIFHDFGVGLNDNETAEIFSGLDVEGTGTIPYELFMERLRPEMSPLRTTTLLEAYGTLIRSVDGLVDIETMRESYNPSCDERVASGEASEEEVLAEFIGRFETGVHMEGKVNRYEFFDYYSAVSASIDDDDEFLELIKNSWKF